MAEPVSLEIVTKRMGALVREYDTAIRRNDVRAPAVLEEIAQLNVVRNELKKVGSQVKLGHGSRPIAAPGEFPTIEALFRRMETLARQIAEMPREHPERHNIVNELTGLAMIADSLAKKTE